MPKSLNVMLLAAGQGQRLRPYTEQVPKPLIPFLGVPMVEYAVSHIEKLCANGVIEVPNLVINTHHLPKQIETYFRETRPKLKTPFWKNLEFSHEPQLLAGGGIKKCEKTLSTTDNFLVINADEVFFFHEKQNPLVEFLNFHGDSLATLLTTSHPDVGTKLGGVWIDQAANVYGFGKTHPSPSISGFGKMPPGSEQEASGLSHKRGHQDPSGLGSGVSSSSPSEIHALHFLGFILLNKKIFDFFQTPAAEENLLYDVMTKGISNDHVVRAFQSSTDWYETGRVEDFQRFEKELTNRRTPALQEFLSKHQKFIGQFPPVIPRL